MPTACLKHHPISGTGGPAAIYADMLRPALAILDADVPHRAALIAAMIGEYTVAHVGPSFHRPGADPVKPDPLGVLAAAVAVAGKKDGPGAGSVHLFCHGGSGRLHLAGGTVDLATLARDRDQVAALRVALDGRPLLLYGCSVGAGDLGRTFVEILSTLLAAPVRASSTPSGGTAHGGDWVLDTIFGTEVEGVPALLDPDAGARWPGLLATVTNTNGDTSAGSLAAAVASGDSQIYINDFGAGAEIDLLSPLNVSSITTIYITHDNGIALKGETISISSYFSFQCQSSIEIDNKLVSISGNAFNLRGATYTLNGDLSEADIESSGSKSHIIINSATSVKSILFNNGHVSVMADVDVTSEINFINGAELDTGAHTVAISGAVRGSTAQFSKTGSGTLALTGTDNTFTGALTINEGTLSVASDDNLGSGYVRLDGGTFAITGETTIDNSVSVLAGGATISTSANATISGNLVSTGNLTKTGAGTLTLTSTNSYSGTTTVGEGTLSVASDGNLGTGAVALDGGTLAVTGAGTIDNAITVGSGNGTVHLTADATLSGTLSGSGGLTKTGSSTLTLTGTNSFIGPTTVSEGTLRLSGGNALDDDATVTVAEGATLDLNGTDETIGALAGAGSITTGTASITLSNAAAGSFAGSLSGTGPFRVAAGATFGGTGTYTTPIEIQSGATIAPGNSPGRISTGNLTLASGSTATMEIDGTTTGTGYDQIDVTGTVTINGATLNLVVGYTPTAGDSYILIANDGTDAVTGTFDGLAEGATISSGGWSYRISYAAGTGNDVVVTAVSGPSSGGGSGGSGSAGSGGTGGADALSGSTAADAFAASAGDDTVRGLDGVDTLSGGAGADVMYGNIGADLVYGNQGSDSLYGGQDGDALYGGQDGDHVWGNLGDDTAWGNVGSDTLSGGGGADVLYGNEAGDGIWGGEGADTLYGGQGDDTLFGDDGADLLCGNLGVDILSGGAGDDTLFGGAGADSFRFGTADGIDRVEDFALGEDILQVTADINGTGIATAADLLARVSDDGAGNALIDLGAGNSVTLIGVNVAALTTDSLLVA